MDKEVINVNEIINMVPILTTPEGWRKWLNTSFNFSLAIHTTYFKPIGWKALSNKYKYFLKNLNSSSMTFFRPPLFTFNFFEPNPGVPGYHQHSLLRGIDPRQANSLAIKLNETFGRSCVHPICAYGITRKHDFTNPFLDPDHIFQQLVDNKLIVPIPYRDHPSTPEEVAGALCQDIDTVQDKVKSIFPDNFKTILNILRKPKDIIRYVSEKMTNRELEKDWYLVGSRVKSKHTFSEPQACRVDPLYDLSKPLPLFSY